MRLLRGVVAAEMASAGVAGSRPAAISFGSMSANVRRSYRTP
jgi:hypothetical protein